MLKPKRKKNEVNELAICGWQEQFKQDTNDKVGDILKLRNTVQNSFNAISFKNLRSRQSIRSSYRHNPKQRSKLPIYQRQIRKSTPAVPMNLTILDLWEFSHQVGHKKHLSALCVLPKSDALNISSKVQKMNSLKMVAGKWNCQSLSSQNPLNNCRLKFFRS